VRESVSMARLPIYLYGSEILRKKAKPIQALDDATIKLMYDMAETMRKANGVGLAATQVGDLRRMLVLDISAIERGETEEGEERPERPAQEAKVMVVMNPEVHHEEGSWTAEEGCLSIPDLHAEVKRAEKIRVKFRDANFEEVELDAGGLLARALLHEIDHLNGVMFVDHLSVARRALLRSELRKIKKGEVDTVYPVISANEA